MIAFADASALVKLYVPEDGNREVRALHSPVAVSQLSRVEVPAAIWRKHRMGELAATDARTLVSAFEADYSRPSGREASSRFTPVLASEAVLTAAARLVAVHPLRAYDAVQLASALAVQKTLDETVCLVAFDRLLRHAAAVEDLPLVPAGDDPPPSE